jgi:hypothetical protein
MIDWTHAFSLTMETRMPPRPLRANRPRRVIGLLVAGLLGAAGLVGCSSGPKLADLPPDIAAAMPTISAEQAEFVLAARERGAMVTGATVADDLEAGTTVCWALKNGGVTLGQIAADENGQPLGNEGDQLRTKRLMAAAVDSLCPDYKDQVAQLNLP